MAFKWQTMIISKIVTGNIILEQVNTFIYLRCKISYEEEKFKIRKPLKFGEFRTMFWN